MKRPLGAALLVLVLACGDATGPNGAVPGSFAAFSLGNDFSCALNTEGSAFCWGNDDQGQLAAGPTSSARATEADRPARILVGPLGFTAISAGDGIACGILGDHRALCWGQLAPQPRALSGGDSLIALKAGSFVCGMHADSLPVCWSDLGAAPTAVASPRLTRLDVDGNYACGLNAQGTPYCWHSSATTAVAVAAAPPLVQLAVGYDHACGLDAAGQAFCWGANQVGQLGDGTTLSSDTAVAVVTSFGTTDMRFLQLTAGRQFTCGITVDTRGRCWGTGGKGQFGAGGGVPSGSFGSRVPWPIVDSLRWQQLEAGGAHTCGITTDGRSYCWGSNQFGQVGDGTDSLRPAPVLIGGAP